MAKQTQQPDTLALIKSAIKNKNPERLYFFHGEEAFLRNYYLEQLKKILVDELTESFNFHKFTSENFEIRDFADAVENLPMMAETTMVVVDDVDFFKFPDTDREKMAEILSDIPEYCTVVFTFETVNWKPDKRFTKLYGAVNEHGTAIRFAKQDTRELVNWVGRHFAANGKKIQPSLCVYLIELTDGTMTSLSGEISKICAYSGADEIVRSDIDAVTEPVLDAVVFQMTDLMGQGNYGAALQKLQDLMKKQEKPLGILGAIGGHFRRLSTARTLLDGGYTATELMKITGLTDYPARKTMSAAGKFSAKYLKKASELILQTDVNIKTSLDDPQRLLEVLLLQLAQEARNG